MDCPKCIGKLQKKELKIYSAHDIKELQGAATSFKLEADQCYVCGGVWFDKGELAKYKTERLTVLDSDALGKGLDQELDSKKGKCPRCDVILKKAPYEKEPSITLDVCEQCGGIWLDSTEIDRVERANKQKFGFLGLLIKGLKRKK